MLRTLIPEEATRHYARQCEHKRLDVLCNLLKQGDAVLDIGCGTGSYSSRPLSWLPITITAIDSDIKTIEYARARNGRKNLEFLVADGETFRSDTLYDLIICSNILEHLRKPEMLLENMKALLKDDGTLYVGLPNGFGVFEMQNTAPRLLCKMGWGKRLVARLMTVKDTLNSDSPHIQFFSIGGAKRLLQRSGWCVMRQMNEEFLGGIVFDRLLPKVTLLAKWNVEWADKIPAQLANGWIFICKKN